MTELLARGFVHRAEPHATAESAWRAARAVIEACQGRDRLGTDMPDLQVVGEYNLPPRGAPVHDFQALHIDFGLPIHSQRPVEAARFTALYVEPDQPPTSARTRLVSLRPLLGQRAWGDPLALRGRVRAYGARQAGSGDYVEGILARLVEAADGSPELPPVGTPGFLCGLEFSSPEEERAHLARRGLRLDRHEVHIPLQPGELLVFDNLATAHGRLGVRSPLELRQLCLGYSQLDVPRQQVLVDRVLEAFVA